MGFSSDAVSLTPSPEHRFSFGLWTIRHPGHDPFGAPTRPSIDPVAFVRRLADLGAYGVSFHDNDLIPLGLSNSDKQSANSSDSIKPLTTPAWWSQWRRPTCSGIRYSRTGPSRPMIQKCAGWRSPRRGCNRPRGGIRCAHLRLLGRTRGDGLLRRKVTGRRDGALQRSDRLSLCIRQRSRL